MTITPTQIGDHLLFHIIAEAPLDEITERTKAFVATLDHESFIMVHQFARTLLAARADEDADISDPDDILRRDLMLAGIGAVRAVTGPPACEHICGNQIFELTPKAWEAIEASRANPDADIDYGLMLELEILAHCAEQTADEAYEINLQIENHYGDPRAAVADIRSGAITFEKLDGWFALLPIAPPTQAMRDIVQGIASLERQGMIRQNGHIRLERKDRGIPSGLSGEGQLTR